MDAPHSQLTNLLSKAEKSLYLRISDLLLKTVNLETELILAGQKIVLDEYDSEPTKGFISRLYKNIFGVQFVGEMPPSLVLINRYQNLYSRPISRKVEKQKKSHVNQIERVYNKRYYDETGIDECRVLYKCKFQSQKLFLIDLDIQQDYPNYEIIKMMFSIYDCTERKQLSQELLKLSELMVNYFEQKTFNILSKTLRKSNLELNNIVVQDRPILSLLLNKLYYQTQKINRQNRNLINCSRSSKYNTRTLAFVDKRLLYNNVDYYLDFAIKKKIIAEQVVKFEQVIQHLEFSEEDTADIIKQAENNGIFVPSHKRWKINVDHSIGWIELSFQIEASQCFGSKNVDERAYLDLFAMVMKIVDAPINSQKNLKSQKAIISRNQTKNEQEFQGLESIIMLTAFEFAPKLDYDDFEFNILDYDIQTTARIVYELLYSRFKDMDLEQQKLQKFIKQIGNMYEIQNNAFHNIYHAFTVLHGAYIISKSDVFNNMFDDQISLTLMVAAYCHDVSHTGVTNFFQQKSVSKLSNRYGDRSILEFNSIARSLSLFAQEEFDFLAYMSQKSWKSFRKLFIQSILATDNKNHLQTISNLQSSMTDHGGDLDSEATSNIIGGILHTVDFWGVVKNYKVSYAWSKRVNEEFQKQYNQQARLQIEQTPYFKDLSNIRVIAKNEQVFIEAIVLPLYKRVDQWSHGYLGLALQRIDENIEIWKKIQSGKEQAGKYL